MLKHELVKTRFVVHFASGGIPKPFRNAAKFQVSTAFLLEISGVERIVNFGVYGVF